MIKVYLVSWDGKTYEMPTVLSWRLLRTGQVPCDDMEVTCLYDGQMLEVMPQINRFWAEENGTILLRGVVDEYAASVSREGMELMVAGRGMAALLLDNEAEAVTYQDATTAEILRNHVAPYGIALGDIRHMVCGGSYQVASGTSQWKALSGFTHFTGGFNPYFTADGMLVVQPLQGSGKRLVLDSSQPVLSCVRRERRYGVISEVLVKDKTRKTEQRVVNSEFLARGGCRRQVIYTPGRSTYAAMRYTGDYQIEQSRLDSAQVELSLMGSCPAQPGDVVELSYHLLGLYGNYNVVETECRGDGDGVTSTLVLEKNM